MSQVVQLRKKGVITLPIQLRRRYGLAEGDVFMITDLGEGAFLLTSGLSEVARLADQASEALSKEGVSTEDLLRALAEERERYYAEHYADD
jgi:bifunctional DNA-binding transcriptional regulator/antitoxin component of YhaV-PrlF toxin-antitoxin module